MCRTLFGLSLVVVVTAQGALAATASPVAEAGLWPMPLHQPVHQPVHQIDPAFIKASGSMQMR